MRKRRSTSAPRFLKSRPRSLLASLAPWNCHYRYQLRRAAVCTSFATAFVSVILLDGGQPHREISNEKELANIYNSCLQYLRNPTVPIIVCQEMLDFCKTETHRFLRRAKRKKNTKHCCTRAAGFCLRTLQLPTDF